MININIPKKIIRLFKQTSQQLQQLRVQQVPAWFDRFPLFREWSTEQAIKEGLKQSVWVYACINKISRSVSSVDWIVEEKTGDEWERVESHPVEQLLKNPNENPIFNGNKLFELEVNHRQLGGNAIWHKVMYNGVPVELWPIKPDRIYPLVNEDGTIDNYEYRPEGTAKRKLIPAEEIVHFMFVDPNNFYWGLSPLQAAGRVVDTDVEAIKHNKSTLDNSVIPSGVFSFKSEQMSPEQYAEIREELGRQVDNPGRPFVIGNDANWESLSYSPEDLQMTELRQLNGREIHAAFDVDPLLTSFPDTGGQVNKKEAKHEFWQDNIIPYLDSLAQGINNNIVVHFDEGRQQTSGEPRLRVRYDLSSVNALREDEAKKIEKAERLYNMGVPFNEINQRLELGFDDIPGGDVPGGMPQVTAGRQPESSKKKREVTAKQIEYAKDMEEQRQEWEDRLEPEMIDFFENEREAVIAAYDQGGIEAVEELIEEDEEELRLLLLAFTISTTEHFGQEEVSRIEEDELADEDAEDLTFTIDDELEEEIEEYSRDHSILIQATTATAITELIRSGQDEGLSNDEIEDNIRGQFNRWTDDELETPRSRMITETEVHNNQERGIDAGGKKVEEEYNVNLTKTWLNMQDERVRGNPNGLYPDTIADHWTLHNETVDREDTFSNGLRYPGDPLAPPEEVIGCRCDMIHEVAR